MTTAEIIEQLRDIVGWKEIIQKHRRKTDDPSITYVLKDGSRIHEDDNSVAKIAATFSRALEESGDIASRAADRLEELEKQITINLEEINMLLKYGRHD